MPENVLLSQVKDLLTESAATRTLPREAQLALQHAEASVKLETKDAQKLLSELKALNFLDEALAVKIADILPQWPEEVRLLASRDRATLDEEKIKAVLDLTAHYR